MEQTGLLDNPMLRYGGPGVLLFIIVALLIQRRSRMQGGFADGTLNIAGVEENAGAAAGSTGGGNSSTTSDFAIYKTSGMSGNEIAAAHDDPVSEASGSMADDTLNKESENESEPYEITIKLSDLFAGDTAEALEEDPEEASSEADDELPDVDSYIDSDLGADTNEDAPAIETDAVDIDPISKANVYLLYGCYQQAEDTLNEALEKEPERHDIKLKLLEVLFAAGNRVSFEQQARDFHDALGDESDPVRARVVTMAEQLCPGIDLFAGDSDEALKDDPEEAASEADDLLDADFYIDSDISAETNEHEPAIETDAVDLDPLSKAHVYLTYSRYQQAEDTLNQMLEKEPERHDIKLKLLEVLFAAGNRVSFEQQAQDFHDALADESDPMWARVVTMAEQLCPGIDLFAGDSDEALKDDPEEAASEADDDLPDLYFDIDSESIDASSVVGDAETDEMFAEPEAVASGDVAAKEAPANPAGAEDNSLEFDLNTLFMSDATETSSDDDAGLDVDPDDIDETECPARYRKYKR
jgi:Tfp pilus assembly protein FimV